MRPSLRGKILGFTVIPLVGLAFATLWLVNGRVTHQVHENIHEDLRRASAVLDNVLDARAQSLTIAGQMTAQDPKFFSVLTIPGASSDPQVRATVSGVARDFNAITGADLFEVTDAEGNVVASVGRDASSAGGREPWVRSALSGRAVSGLLSQENGHFQLTSGPVLAGGRVVGTLLLGARIGHELAAQMRELTRSEVTFVSGQAITGSTLESTEEREAVLMALRGVASRPSSADKNATLLEVRGGIHLYLTLVRPLVASDAGAENYYVMQRALDAETAFLRQTQVELVGLGLLAVVAVLFAGLAIADRITSPIQKLVRGAEEMERGNYDFPLGDPSKDEIGALATRFDVMRRQQREVVRSLQQVTRIKSEFLNVASHELRTPISIIRGFQELMMDGTLGELTPPQRLALEATDQSVATLARIAEDATRMAQIEGDLLVIHAADQDIGTLVSQAVSAARFLGGRRRVALNSRIPEDLGSAALDGPNLVTALTNVISNGIRFTPDGGHVDVRADRRGGVLIVAVEDNGVGIAPEHQAMIFDRTCALRESLHHHSSSTLEFNSAGLGLGLPIARGIIEAHGGSITVDSTLDVGTTFTITIPIHAARESEKRSERAA